MSVEIPICLYWYFHTQIRPKSTQYNNFLLYIVIVWRIASGYCIKGLFKDHTLQDGRSAAYDTRGRWHNLVLPELHLASVQVSCHWPRAGHVTSVATSDWCRGGAGGPGGCSPSPSPSRTTSSWDPTSSSPSSQTPNMRYNMKTVYRD